MKKGKSSGSKGSSKGTRGGNVPHLAPNHPGDPFAKMTPTGKGKTTGYGGGGRKGMC